MASFNQYNDCINHIKPQGQGLAQVTIGSGVQNDIVMSILPDAPVKLRSANDNWELELEKNKFFGFALKEVAGSNYVLIPEGDPGAELSLTRTDRMRQMVAAYDWPALAVTPGSSPGPSSNGIGFWEGGSLSLWVTHGEGIAQLVLQHVGGD
ncbi:MAG: hypothetical protein GY711_06250 [bacterium]|nr:hypothetical protein [bacterium]